MAADPVVEGLRFHPAIVPGHVSRLASRATSRSRSAGHSAGEDRVHHRVAQRPVRHEQVVAQDAVLLRAEPFDRRPGRGVARVGAQFDGDAVQRPEGVVEQQELRLRVDRRPLGGGRVPGAADLPAPVHLVDVQVVGEADDPVVREPADGERLPRTGRDVGEPLVDERRHPLRGGDHRHRRLPQPPVGRGSDEPRHVVAVSGSSRIQVPITAGV